MSLLSTTALAINPTTSETPVKYTGIGTQTWELEVPAQLKPGQTGEVKLTGTWSSSKRIDVNVDEQVELVNNIDGVSKELKVEFNNISEIGNNTLPIEIKEIIVVEEITDALFGEWTGNIIYNLSCKEYDTISVDKSNYEITGSKALEININNPTDGEVTIENSNTSVANAEIQNEKLIVTPKKVGTTKITVTSAETNTYKSSKAEFNVTVNRANNTLTITKSTYTINNANNLVVTATNKSNGTLTVTSSDTSMATVSKSGNTLTIVPKAEGVVTITVKSAQTNLYNSTSTTFKVNISHNYTNGVCERCGEKDINSLSAGLYDSNWNLITPWQQFITNKVIYNNNGVITTNANSPTDGSIIQNGSAPYLNGVLVIPEGIHTLGQKSFASCNNLTGLVLPSTLKSIEANTFYGYNGKLSTIIVNSNNPYFKTVNGVLYNINMDTIIRYPTSKTDTKFTIPSSVKVIYQQCFQANKHIKTVTIPYGVEHIKGGTFGVCTALTTVNIPESVKIIDNWSFNTCTSLKTLRLPDSLEHLGVGVFSQSNNLKKIYIPSSCITTGQDKHLSGNRGTFWGAQHL